jgi:hypothetical protein
MEIKGMVAPQIAWCFNTPHLGSSIHVRFFMALTPTISSPSDLLHKLERELWRAFHHRHRVHKADHFYNFCITALALKDYFFEWKGLLAGDPKRKPYYSAWDAIPELVAAAEIANTTKHFVLREKRTNLPKSTKTSKVRNSVSMVAEVYVTESGELKVVKNTRAPSITIELGARQKFRLYDFMDTLVKFWETFLRNEGIKIKKQRPKVFYGET